MHGLPPRTYSASRAAYTEGSVLGGSSPTTCVSWEQCPMKLTHYPNSRLVSLPFLPTSLSANLFAPTSKGICVSLTSAMRLRAHILLWVPHIATLDCAATHMDTTKETSQLRKYWTTRVAFTRESPRVQYEVNKIRQAIIIWASSPDKKLIYCHWQKYPKSLCPTKPKTNSTANDDK
jgi:hypothetical protein